MREKKINSNLLIYLPWQPFPALHKVIWFNTLFIILQWVKLHGLHSPFWTCWSLLRHLWAWRSKISCCWIRRFFSGSAVAEKGIFCCWFPCCWNTILSQLDDIFGKDIWCFSIISKRSHPSLSLGVNLDSYILFVHTPVKFHVCNTCLSQKVQMSFIRCKD